jgi:hypothetical protein
MKTRPILALCLLFTGFTSVNLETSPLGTWVYNITGTPEGDFTGNLVVSEDKGKYIAVLKSGDAHVPLVNPVYVKATQKLKGTFDYQGNTILLECITAGDTMTGTVSTGDSSFPFKATRKK